ncbi:hypothetical protein NDN08_006612 [Rhodosorus marinus]|uniref:Uncharacterized protein n=1 Tax=Rhodosorus marinus TaxID=101924 RepID=A0AAV8UI27_9RHOD|nr:hypothetical protein NDN08_006612 [Rhodosorus marinus]
MSESDDVEQRLAELDLSCLDDLGDGYLRTDFGPHVEALRILRNSDRESQIKQLKESKRLLERVVDQIAPLCVETFSDALVTLSSVGRSVEQIKGQNWSPLSGERISEAADHRNEDLESSYYELVKATESLRILDLTEEFMWMRKDAQSELVHGNLAEGAALLSRAAEILARPPLNAIQALREEREGLVNQLRETFVNCVGLLVSRLSAAERSGDVRDEPTWKAIPTLVNSLKTLEQERDIDTEIKRSLVTALYAMTWKYVLLETTNKDNSSMISALHQTTETAEDIRAGALQSILPQASASTCERILGTVFCHMTSFLRHSSDVVSVLTQSSARESELALTSIWGAVEDILMQLTKAMTSQDGWEGNTSLAPVLREPPTLSPNTERLFALVPIVRSGFLEFFDSVDRVMASRNVLRTFLDDVVETNLVREIGQTLDRFLLYLDIPQGRLSLMEREDGSGDRRSQIALFYQLQVFLDMAMKSLQSCEYSDVFFFDEFLEAFSERWSNLVQMVESWTYASYLRAEVGPVRDTPQTADSSVEAVMQSVIGSELFGRLRDLCESVDLAALFFMSDEQRDFASRLSSAFASLSATLSAGCTWLRQQHSQSTAVPTTEGDASSAESFQSWRRLKKHQDELAKVAADTSALVHLDALIALYVKSPSSLSE